MFTSPPHGLRPRPAHGRRCAFTLIELIVVIAIIAILAGMLEPSFAKARAKARTAAMKSNVKLLMMGVQMFADDHEERLPASVTDFFNETYFDSEFLNRFTVVGDDRLRGPIEDELYCYMYPPEEPPEDKGFDGTFSSIENPAQTVFIRVKGSYSETTPSARGYYLEGYGDGHAATAPRRDGIDQVQAQIEQTQALGAEAAMEVVKLAGDADLSLESLKHDMTELESVVPAAEYFDMDNDGFVTATDLLLAAVPPDPPSEENPAPGDPLPEDPPTPFTILQEFVTEAVTILDLDPEDPVFDELPQIPVEELVLMATEEADGLFSAESVGELAIQYSTKLGPALGLCAKLDAAAAAEPRGEIEARDNILEAFRHQLRAQTGESFTPEQAETLEMLSRTLQTTQE